MKNFNSFGHNIQLIAPAGGVKGGTLYAANQLVGVVASDASEGDQFTLSLTGVYSELRKEPALSWTVGEPLYMVPASTSVTNAQAGNIFVGYAFGNVDAADETCTVLLAR